MKWQQFMVHNFTPATHPLFLVIVQRTQGQLWHIDTPPGIESLLHTFKNQRPPFLKNRSVILPFFKNTHLRKLNAGPSTMFYIYGVLCIHILVKNNRQKNIILRGIPLQKCAYKTKLCSMKVYIKRNSR